MKPEDTVRYLEYIKKHDRLFEEKEEPKRIPLIVYIVAILLVSTFAFLTWVAWNMEWEWGVVIFGSGLVGTAVGSMSAISKLASDGETEWVPDKGKNQARKDDFLINPIDPASPLYHSAHIDEP